MIYRVELAVEAIRQIGGIPEPARVALQMKLAEVIENPRDPVITDPTDVKDFRSTDFGHFGYIEYEILDDLVVVVVHEVIWAG